MQGPPCAHHRYKSHAGAVFSFPYNLQVTLYNPSLSAMLSFRDQNTTQHTALLIFCPLLQLLGDQWRRGQRITSPLIPVNSHLVCGSGQEGRRELRSQFHPSRQFKERKVILSAVQKQTFTHDDQKCLGF